MRHTVKVPVLGDTTRSVVIRDWICTVGSRIEAGAPLVAVDTDKVSVDIPSPVTGVVVEHLANPDDEIATGAPLCIIEGEG